MEPKDREFLPSWAMPWEDITDQQLCEVFMRASAEQRIQLLGKARTFYREEGRRAALEEEVEKQNE